MYPGLFTGHPAAPPPNRRQRRAYLQRSSNCRKPSRGHRLQVVPMGPAHHSVTFDTASGYTRLHATLRFKHIRHKRA